ncbi:hypothetical protein C8Q75DRAFT_122384 [Abortiporus biennis]|nr:hypothetical protein C8Q75DRAFT_122384 [Abortiporus biennis]
MSEYTYAEMSYCSLCDRYFPGEEARAAHVQTSANHPLCEPCNKRFANRNSLRNHWVSSNRHNYCAACDREFKTAAGLRIHIEYAAVHRDDSDDEYDSDDDFEEAEGWEDNLGSSEYPYEDDPANVPASDNDDLELEGSDYWDEDDELDFSDDAETYYGFAAIHPSSSVIVRPRNHDVPRQYGSPEIPSAIKEEVREGKEEPRPSGIYFSCSLCLEAPKETSSTRCGHVFCTECITIALNAKRSCPVCRRPAGPKQLRRLYLSANC